MPTSVNVNELPSAQASSQDRPSLKDRLADGGAGAVIAGMIAIGLACLAANAVYNSSSAAGRVEPRSVGRSPPGRGTAGPRGALAPSPSVGREVSTVPAPRMRRC